MITEQKVRVFLSVAETLSFTETASRLFITQQAVSRHISRFEEDLGFQLFIRSTHRVTLTLAGERARAIFQNTADAILEFFECERQNQQTLDKSLRIGYNNYVNFGRAITSARKRFNDIYPEIEHMPERLPPDLLQARLRHGNLDLILVFRRFLFQETDLHIVELARFPLSVIISKSFDAIGGLDLARLSEMPLFINSLADETRQDTISRAKREMSQIGLYNKKIVITPNKDSVHMAVETGKGIAIACSLLQASPDIIFLPTHVYDTLVCVCLDSAKRRLIAEYMEILRDEFQDPANTAGS
jgi:DNA-binding transcriptional LysR family regulator